MYEYNYAYYYVIKVITGCHINFFIKNWYYKQIDLTQPFR